ncbi:MAG TPA: aminotransferase class IV [Pyrinomonadaceae bacterium]|nr:aminotransferase class IV [Pyrinomonadaceae bacterium]
MTNSSTNTATAPNSIKEEKPVAAFPLCFHKDAFIPWERATLHANSLALRYALSVFEGIRVYVQSDGTAARAFRLDDHLDRLRRSLRLMRLPSPPGVDIGQVINEVIKRNAVNEDSYVRVSVSADNFGDIGAVVRTCLNVSVSRMGRKKWLAEERAMRVAISHWQRAPEAAFPAAAKNISNYAGPRLALLEARDNGYDSVILTNHEGFLSESPTAILFVVRDGVLLTPPLNEGVLPSITRATVFDLCKTLGIEAREQRLSQTDGYLADEAFLCGTGLEFAPIAAFDSHALTAWKEWPITPRIIDAYFQHARGKTLEEISAEQTRDIAQGKGI